MISLTGLLQDNIMGISKFLNAVKIWWNNQYSILRKSSTTVLLYHSWNALVHTQYRPGMYKYVQRTYYYVQICIKVKQTCGLKGRLASTCLHQVALH